MDTQVNFIFTQYPGDNNIFKIVVYKDDVQEAEELKFEGSPLSVKLDLDGAGDSAGAHTYKFKIIPENDDASIEAGLQSPSVVLSEVVTDGTSHLADNVFADDIKIYNLLTADAAQLIADGTSHSDGQETVDLNVGEGSQTYYYSNGNNNGGLANNGGVYVFTYQEPFATWYASFAPTP